MSASARNLGRRLPGCGCAWSTTRHTAGVTCATVENARGSDSESRRKDAVRPPDEYEGMIAETISLPGHGGDEINAYYARPLGPGPYPAIVLFHHRPGWDEWYKEATRKFAHHGYVAICPDLFSRFPPGPPDEVA